MKNKEKFNKLLNTCFNPQAVYAALLALSKDVFIDKRRQVQHEEES